MQNKLEVNGYSNRDILIVLGVILLSKSLYYETYGGNYLLIAFFFLLAFIIIPNIKNFRVDRIILIYSLGLLALILLNLETNNNQLLVLFIRLLIGILIIHLISFERFSIAFIRVMIVLSLFSWLAMIIIMFNINSPLPPLTSTHYIEEVQGRILRNFIIFGVDESFVTYNILRASGLWWEPGAFQIFVNLAFAFSLINNTISKRTYTIFLITILAAMSTTGVIVFGLLSIIYFKKYFIVTNPILFLIPIFIVLIGLLVAAPEIFEKLTSRSSLSRYHDVLISINMFAENILLGYGYGTQVEKAIPYGKELLGLELYNMMPPSGSDGITMFIAQVGIFGIFFIYPLLFPVYCKHMKLYSRLLISLSLFLLFNTQYFTNMLIFTLLTFYGLIKYKNMDNDLKEQ